MVSSNLATDASLEHRRINSNAACHYFFSAYPVGFESSDDVVTGRHGPIPLRQYRNALAEVVADAFDICWQPKSIVVGISAGATLAAALSHRLKNTSRKPFGQALVYSGLGGDLFDRGSNVTNAAAPLLTTADIL
ncbi:MAG: acetyl esterase/lipase [Chitinophagales bacterium]|jgi:acetyl esterase/lipase